MKLYFYDIMSSWCNEWCFILMMIWGFSTKLFVHVKIVVWELCRLLVNQALLRLKLLKSLKIYYWGINLSWLVIMNTVILLWYHGFLVDVWWCCCVSWWFIGFIKKTVKISNFRNVVFPPRWKRFRKSKWWKLLLFEIYTLHNSQQWFNQ